MCIAATQRHTHSTRKACALVLQQRQHQTNITERSEGAAVQVK